MMPVAGETSLATIQSQPLRARLARAFASTDSVSAAKPTTSFGRSRASFETVAKISGFSANSSTGGRPEPSFFSFCAAAPTTRQSATAAAKTAASAGKAAITASRICTAVSTFTTVTPCGGGTGAGPVTNVTCAPKSRSAAAIAVPCAPDERLAMNRTGSMGSCVGPEVTSTCRPKSGPSASIA